MDAADLRYEGKKSSSFRSRFITESQGDRQHGFLESTFLSWSAESYEI